MGHYSEQQIEQEDMHLSDQSEPTIDDILDERGANYGNFAHQAILSQTLKNSVMQHYFQTHGGNEAEPLPAYMVEAISMICHKLARIANGDPSYIDSWTDISGYSQLVVEQLQGKSRQGN